LPACAADYQPSPEQRTTTQLLRYMAVFLSAGIHCMRESNWKLFAEHTATVKEMTAEQFPEAMARQKKDVEAFFEGVTEEQLETQMAPMPWGQTFPLGVAILNGPFKWAVAYKMQLFLYAKATGATQLKTANAWRGTDPAPPPSA
jgi:hypothetical protein